MKKLIASKLIAAFMLLLCFKAEAVETTFLNNTFKINLPENYCTLIRILTTTSSQKQPLAIL